MPERDTHIYCAVTAIVTLCVIVPEVAVIVRFDVVGAAVMLAGRLVAEGGQIKLLRESMNVLAAVQAPNPK
jgi:hypothetical protein